MKPHYQTVYTVHTKTHLGDTLIRHSTNNLEWTPLSLQYNDDIRTRDYLCYTRIGRTGTGSEWTTRARTVDGHVVTERNGLGRVVAGGLHPRRTATWHDATSVVVVDLCACPCHLVDEVDYGMTLAVDLPVGTVSNKTPAPTTTEDKVRRDRTREFALLV